ncbi:MAG: hypothetical protein WAU21_01325 [Chitinophagales bacterium]|nr:hypothetical protein [Bacteroidota bacterium]MBK8488319.1 hypothetical protein [Bacteroidota bacterium]MBK8681938.1 hypothetical protein [Bacteroidota bacterium]
MKNFIILQLKGSKFYIIFICIFFYGCNNRSINFVNFRAINVELWNKETKSSYRDIIDECHANDYIMYPIYNQIFHDHVRESVWPVLCLLVDFRKPHKVLIVEKGSSNFDYYQIIILFDTEETYYSLDVNKDKIIFETQYIENLKPMYSAWDAVGCNFDSMEEFRYTAVYTLFENNNDGEVVIKTRALGLF